MSFDLICSSCGASSGPSVGVCPFCKSLMVSEDPTNPKSPAYKNLVKLYNEGKLETALYYVQEILKQEEKYSDDAQLLLISAKILFETEGPNGKTRALLGKALLLEPDNHEIIDYLDIIQARFDLASGSENVGKESLLKLLRRLPENPHVLFMVGSHLYWREKNCYGAIPYLEKCVRVRPVFLRAWACLAAIAKELGNAPLAESALQHCISIESNAPMKKFFLELQEQLSTKKAA